MSFEILNLILNLLNSTILAILFVYLRFNVDKRLKKYEYLVGDIGELNRKMHDRLVKIEDLINHLKPIDQNTKKRLLMNSSRLVKYDSSISTAVDNLIKTWSEAFLSEEMEAVDIDKYGEKKEECLKIINEIKTKIDRLLK